MKKLDIYINGNEIVVISDHEEPHFIQPGGIGFYYSPDLTIEVHNYPYDPKNCQ